ncbi:MAG TPA: hypothetical protein VNZ67_13055 [bacterium]|jgi:hypothetical protein|nr:hypothetical protein [bacterium]
MVQRTGLRLKDYLICVAALRPLETWELDQAWAAWLQGDAKARRLIEERHLHSVVAWVQPYRACGVSFGRLLECGNRALLKALRHPPVERSADLAEYLRQAVEQAVEDRFLSRRQA